MKRRQLIKYVGLLGALTALPLYKFDVQAAESSQEINSPSGYMKFKLGKLELLVVTDGHIFIQPAQPIFAPDIDAEQVKLAMKDNFIFDDAVDAAINILVIRKDDRIIIIDAGSGSALGDQAGRFLKNLNAAGISASQVTDVLISHLHVDHIGGILTADGKPVFSNATYYLSDKEHAFWTATHPDFSNSKSQKGDAASILLARNIILAIKSKLNLYHFGETLFGCIKTDSAEGHTPGHPLLKIFSDKESLTHMVDAVHTTLLLSHPEWGTAWDSNFQKGIATRKKILKDQSISGGLTMSCHLPWPGLGYITRKGEGYGWNPMPIATPSL